MLPAYLEKALKKERKTIQTKIWKVGGFFTALADRNMNKKHNTIDAFSVYSGTLNKLGGDYYTDIIEWLNNNGFFSHISGYLPKVFNGGEGLCREYRTSPLVYRDLKNRNRISAKIKVIGSEKKAVKSKRKTEKKSRQLTEEELAALEWAETSHKHLLIPVDIDIQTICDDNLDRKRKRRLNKPIDAEKSFISIFNTYHQNLAGDYRIKFTNKCGKLSSSFCGLSADIRRLVLLDGEETVELDLKASHPNIINDNAERFLLDEKERDLWNQFCQVGNFWTNLVLALYPENKALNKDEFTASRDRVKEDFWRALYHHPSSEVDYIVKKIREHFPVFMKTIRKMGYDLRNDKKGNPVSIQNMLQKAEAKIVLDCVIWCKEQQILILTVNDSFTVKKTDAEKVMDYFTQCLGPNRLKDKSKKEVKEDGPEDDELINFLGVSLEDVELETKPIKASQLVKMPTVRKTILVKDFYDISGDDMETIRAKERFLEEQKRWRESIVFG